MSAHYKVHNLLVHFFFLVAIALSVTAAPVAMPAPQAPSSTTAPPAVATHAATRKPTLPIVYFSIDKETGEYVNDVFLGPIVEGRQFGLVYDPARAKCDHVFDSNGVDSWTVNVGFISTTGEIVPFFTQAGYVDSFNSTVSPTVPIPAMPSAGTVQIWFYCTNSAGQIIYDSNFGKNWVVEVETWPWGTQA
ncbi:hypothetical protein HK102_013877 [Quaeritorhiza haematococci]|nr:hypothetical protein HK102_013877 [Quaeritorhiza haematococci]